MKNKLRSIRDHINRHRFAYGVTTGLTAGLWLVHRNAVIVNEFLEEHDLLDEFYFLDEE